MTTVHEVAIRTAANRWYDAEDDSTSKETGVVAIAGIVKAVAPLVEQPECANVVEAAATLLSLLAKFTTDLDGEATLNLVNALTQAGFPPPEPIVPLTGEEREELWQMWMEVFRDDPSEGVEMLTQEWTDRDFRNEFDDYRMED